jgi:hypothetical protein
LAVAEDDDEEEEDDDDDWGRHADGTGGVDG